MNILLLFLAWSYALLGGFLIYSAAHRAWNTLKPVVKIILSPFMIFWFVDVGFNLIFGSLIFLERPHELTFTKRCDSWLHAMDWRGTIARAICNHLLNPFDTLHCQ